MNKLDTMPQEVLDVFNKIWASTYKEVSWRYYRNKGSKFAHSWTTEPYNGKYFYRKWKITKKKWEVVEKQEYNLRKEAKEVAHYYWSQEKELGKV